jgi:type IV pilus assembly protein PilC
VKFNYTAQNAAKDIVSGSIAGADKFAVARALRADGLLPLSVREEAVHADVKVAIENFFSRVSLRDKILFTHNLAGMLTAGLTLYRALEVEKKQNKNPALEKIFDGLLATINQGGTLSDGLAKYPKVFSPLFVSMVRAGEESGNLVATLNEVGTTLQKSYDLSRKIKGAMMYPAIIVIAICIIGVLMLIFVVPTLTRIFKDLGTALPPTTQFVVSLSDFASGHPFIFLGSISAVVAALAFIIKSKRMKPINDKVMLKIPVVGMIIKEVNTARTARTLSSLLLAGVEMTRALEITKEVMQNIYYRKVIEEAQQAIQKGGTLSAIFKENENLYPIMVSEMIAVGEETGALTKMLSDVAVFYEEEVDAKTKDLSTIVEPVLMMFIGAGVGFFAISMISPMYSLLNNI